MWHQAHHGVGHAAATMVLLHNAAVNSALSTSTVLTCLIPEAVDPLSAMRFPETAEGKNDTGAQWHTAQSAP